MFPIFNFYTNLKNYFRISKYKDLIPIQFSRRHHILAVKHKFDSSDVWYLKPVTALQHNSLAYWLLCAQYLSRHSHNYLFLYYVTGIQFTHPCNFLTNIINQRFKAKCCVVNFQHPRIFKKSRKLNKIVLKQDLSKKVIIQVSKRLKRFAIITWYKNNIFKIGLCFLSSFPLLEVDNHQCNFDLIHYNNRSAKEHSNYSQRFIIQDFFLFPKIVFPRMIKRCI